MAITEQQFNELERRVRELEAFVEQKKVQQISFPLDEASQKIIINVTA